MLARALLALCALGLATAAPRLRQESAIAIDGPFATGIDCPTVYNWTGGFPPYTVAFSNIDTPGRVVPVEVYPNISTASFTWLPRNNDTGQMLLLTVRDALGDEGELNWVVVESEVVC